MISRASKFEFLDRGASKTILLVPGWASDHRVFDTLDLKANYLLPTEFSPFGFDKCLSEALDRYNLDKIDAMGHSMGGFVVSDLLSGYGDKINAVVFAGVRGRYEKGVIDETRAKLRNNKRAFLYKFYRNWFSDYEKKGLAWFKRNLLNDYIEKIGMDKLLEGLDYLSEAQMNPDALCGVKLRFIHGAQDKIAPIEKALELKNSLPGSEFIAMENTGHMPFLNMNFKRIFYNGHDLRR